MSAPRPSGLTIARHARRFAKRYALTIADGTEEHHDQRYACVIHCQCEDHYYRMRDCKHIEAWHVLRDRAYYRRRILTMHWIRELLRKAFRVYRKPPIVADDECPHGFFVGRGCTFGCIDDEGQRADPPRTI